MKNQQIYLWATVSMLYVSGCLWLFFGTLYFDGLDWMMRRQDFSYMLDCRITAFLGVLMASVPVVCLWLEFRTIRRFGRISFWFRRYGVCVLVATTSAVFLWFLSHASIEYPYSEQNKSPSLIHFLYALILACCISRSRRVRMTFRKN